MKLDELHEKMRAKYVQELDSGEVDETIDGLLNSHDPEICEQCGWIFCPYNEPLHFHHDGCPCCTYDGPMEKLEGQAKLLKRLAHDR